VVSRFDVVGGITGLIQGVLVTNVSVTTQGRAVVLTWASVGFDLAYSLLIGSVVGRTPHSSGHRSQGGGPVPKVVPTACSHQGCHR
jgi:hypothetical protein